jgi:hypothetical protein
VELGSKTTAAITEENVVDLTSGSNPGLLMASLRDRGTHGAFRGLRIASPVLQKALGRNRVPDLLGSNFSVSTALLHEVNGYNEDFQTYWGEDGDLFVRLRNSGATLCGIKGFAEQWHLRHPRLEPDAKSQARYRDLLTDPVYKRCRNGILGPGSAL